MKDKIDKLLNAKWPFLYECVLFFSFSTKSLLHLHSFLFALVYDRNHLFGVGPIPKPKLKIGRNFRPIPKLTETVKS